MINANRQRLSDVTRCSSRPINAGSAQCRSLIDSTTGRSCDRSSSTRDTVRWINARAAGASTLSMLRWVAEDVHEHVDHSLDLGLVDDRQQLRRPQPGDLANVFDVERRVEIEVSAQRIGDGEPHVGLAVRHACTLQHGGVDRVVQVVDQLVGEP